MRPEFSLMLLNDLDLFTMFNKLSHLDRVNRLGIGISFSTVYSASTMGVCNVLTTDVCP